jgi:hypothetical protein
VGKAYESLIAEVLKSIDGDPLVICMTRWQGEGKGSGTSVDVRSVDAYEVQDRMILRTWGGFPDLDTAQDEIAAAA